jgi:hypothetical protein
MNKLAVDLLQQKGLNFQSMHRQQRGLKMVLAYVTNVLVKMNMFRTRCMLFYYAKTIEFVS